MEPNRPIKITPFRVILASFSGIPNLCKRILKLQNNTIVFPLAIEMHKQ